MKTVSQNNNRLNFNADSMVDRIRIARIVEDKDLQKAFALRHQVFVEEQNVPTELELDELDQQAIHWGVWLDTELIGTARIIVKNDEAKGGRIALRKNCRRLGLGKHLLQAMLLEAQLLGLKRVYGDAQLRLVDFYTQLGFVPEGEVFIEAGIEHIRMVKHIVSSK